MSPGAALASREALTGLGAATVGLGLVVALGVAGWPGQPFDCTASAGACFCELSRPGLVRQLGNTWSNLGAVLAGVLMGFHAASLREVRRRAFAPNQGLDTLGLLFPAVLVFQGVGSMLFHGGLTVWGSALDAMSMFATTGLLVATDLLRLGRVGARGLVAVWASLMAAGVTAGFVVPQAVPDLVFALFVTILAMEVVLTRRGATPSASLFRLGLGIHLLGVVVWFLSASAELPLCAPDSPWQGHGLWHLTAATAVTLFALHAFRNLSLLGARPTAPSPS
jgi:Ceramidase